jgi:WD40 repeat protein
VAREDTVTVVRLALLSLTLAATACTAPSEMRPAAQPFPAEPQAVPALEHHTARVAAVAVERAGRWAVTGGFDKTVRVWDVAAGEIVRTIHLPTAPGDAGRVFALAMDPEARWFVAGGFTAPRGEAERLYVFERATGRLAHVLPTATSVHALAVSAEGDRLAVGLCCDAGVRLFDTRTWTEVAARRDLPGTVYGLDFAADGRLAVAAHGGAFGVYDRDLNVLSETRHQDRTVPFDIAFSARGDRLAIGYADRADVRVVDAATLRRLHQFRVSGGNLARVAWSAGGERVCAGGRYALPDLRHPWVCWPAGGGPPTEHPFAAENTIDDGEALPDGGFLLVSTDAAVARLDSGGDVVWQRASMIADFATNWNRAAATLQVDRSGRRVGFAFDTPRDRGVFTFDLAELALTPKRAEGLQPAVDGAEGLRLEHDGGKVLLNGRPLPGLDDGERPRAAAVAPDGARFVLATSWALWAYDSAGEPHWRVYPGQAVWAVNVTPDGRTVVAGLGDGTIRWYDLADGAELFRLFAQPDGRWVAWTPDGFFAASNGGEELIAYVVNREDALPEVVEVSQFAHVYYRPDVVLAGLERDREVIRTARAEVGDVEALLARERAPSLRLLGSERRRIEDGRPVTVEFEIEDRGSGIGELVLKVNGQRRDRPGERRPITTRREGLVVRETWKLDLPAGEHELSVEVASADGRLRSPPERLTVEVDDDPFAAAPALWGIAIGVTDYYDSALNLEWPALDAERVHDLLEAQERRIFRAADIRLLLDEDATAARIAREFEAIASEIQPQDVFVFYLAGHGEVWEGNYHFVPYEAAFTSGPSFLKQSLDEDELVDLLATINADKRVVMVDTCYAGAFDTVVERSIADKTALDRLMRASGDVWLAASSDRETALEGYKRHGVFTYAVLEGLRGAADPLGDNHVSVDELADFLEDEVPELSYRAFGKRQVPMRHFSGVDFDLARYERR